MPALVTATCLSIRRERESEASFKLNFLRSRLRAFNAKSHSVISIRSSAVFCFRLCRVLQAGTKNQLPSRIRTVAVPAFQNNALRYKIESRFTEAVVNELIHRGRGLARSRQPRRCRCRIEGVIKSFSYGGVLLDDRGRARIFEVTIEAAITVRDQTENRVLYDNQNFVFRGEYEFANDPRNFFNEEDPAVERMARNFAESIVSTLTNAVQLSK